MQASPLITLSPSSPSFKSCSSSKLAEIAARVVQEFANESESSSSVTNDNNIFSWDEEIFFPPPVSLQQLEQINYNHQNDSEHGSNAVVDDDFEFAVVHEEADLSPISADDIFYNGQIRPIYPFFNTDLLLNNHPQQPSSKSATTNQPKKSHRLPLRKLFDEERETASCSSSEADELDGVPTGTYCVWTPKKAEELTRGRKQSCSTGSSKRWKFRDLLYRSNSDGKDTFVFLTPSSKKCNETLGGGDEGKENNKEKGKDVKGVVFEDHYVRNRAIKEGDKRRSFLPYRQDLVGFLSNVNGVGRNLHPF